MILAMAAVTMPGQAHAQAEPEGPGDASYYYDPGALVIYGAGLGALAATLLLEPPETPRFFSPSAGGAEYHGSTVPSWTLSLFGAATFTTVVATSDKARWYHAKGFLGAYATTALTTELAKNLVGRHRPDYDPTHPDAGGIDGRKSFFSGHSSLTLVSTTYAALYLHDHVFPGLRSGDGIAWWEIATYTGLAALSVYVPYSRVSDNRHNPSDILVGSAVGLGVAVLFYYWQNSRYQDTQEADPTAAPGVSNLLVAPTSAPLGMSMAFTW